MQKSILLLCGLIFLVNGQPPSPPRLKKQSNPEMLYFVAGAGENIRPFQLACEAEGDPPIKYHWTKNGKPFDWKVYKNRMQQQNGRGTVFIHVPADYDKGRYQCFAENEFGTAMSNSVHVRKAELKAFDYEETKKVSIEEGSPLKLECKPPKGWPRPRLSWMIQSNDGMIKSVDSPRMTVDPEGNLWFSNVTKEDESNGFNYACSATSAFRNEYKLGSRVVIEVLQNETDSFEDIVFEHEPIKQYVSDPTVIGMQSKKVELFCIYGGTPMPEISWFKDDAPVEANDRIIMKNYGRSLYIKRLSSEDEGNYTCEAFNGVGLNDNYTISLEIHATPRFVKEMENVVTKEDEEVEFTCEVVGLPEPEINWIFNGKSISEEDEHPRRLIEGNKVSIIKLDKTDIGNYGCNGTNAYGYVYKEASLTFSSLQ